MSDNILLILCSDSRMIKARRDCIDEIQRAYPRHTIIEVVIIGGGGESYACQTQLSDAIYATHPEPGDTLRVIATGHDDCKFGTTPDDVRNTIYALEAYVPRPAGVIPTFEAGWFKRNTDESWTFSPRLPH